MLEYLGGTTAFQTSKPPNPDQPHTVLRRENCHIYPAATRFMLVLFLLSRRHLLLARLFVAELAPSGSPSHPFSIPHRSPRYSSWSRSLQWPVGNPFCPPCCTKETTFTVTMNQIHLADPCRLTSIVIWIVLIALPVQPDSVINELHLQVYLKVVSSFFLVCIALPVIFAFVRKEYCDLEHRLDKTLQYPAKEAQVPPILSEKRQGSSRHHHHSCRQLPCNQSTRV
jgi:hypothetical protein